MGPEVLLFPRCERCGHAWSDHGDRAFGVCCVASSAINRCGCRGYLPVSPVRPQ